MSAICYGKRRERRYALLILQIGQESQRNECAVNIKRQTKERMRDKLLK